MHGTAPWHYKDTADVAQHPLSPPCHDTVAQHIPVDLGLVMYASGIIVNSYFDLSSVVEFRSLNISITHTYGTVRIFETFLLGPEETLKWSTVFQIDLALVLCM
jgi:hypothetical protein